MHFYKKNAKIFGQFKKKQYLCTRFRQERGAIAQLVEQRTENPCVPGSIPGGTTKDFDFEVFFYVQRNLGRIMTHKKFFQMLSMDFTKQEAIEQGKVHKISKTSLPINSSIAGNYGFITGR